MKPYYLYVLRANGLYKIGRSRNPQHRIRQLQTGCAYRYEVVSLIETHHHGLERAIHRKFVDQRQLGEWYVLSPGDIEWINGFAAWLKPSTRGKGRCFSWVRKERPGATLDSTAG